MYWGDDASPCHTHWVLNSTIDTTKSTLDTTESLLYKELTNEFRYTSSVNTSGLATD